MLHFLKLIKFKNLFVILFTLFLFKYGFLIFQGVPLALNNWQFLLLVLACLFIATAAYLINSVFDTDIEELKMSESKAYNCYVILNITGVGIGFYLANLIGKPSFSALFIGVAATSYVYASSLKQNLLIGNFIQSLTLSFCILIVGIFDLFPVILPQNKPIMTVLFQVMIDYSVFCFMILFLREIVTDLKNINRDYNSGKRTLPIILGVKRTTKLVFALSIIPVIAVIYYIYTYIFNLEIATGYLMLFVLGPLLYFSIKTWIAKTTKDFNTLSLILNGILILGILSILIITLNKKYYA